MLQLCATKITQNVLNSMFKTCTTYRKSIQLIMKSFWLAFLLFGVATAFVVVFQNILWLNNIHKIYEINRGSHWCQTRGINEKQITRWLMSLLMCSLVTSNDALKSFTQTAFSRAFNIYRCQQHQFWKTTQTLQKRLNFWNKIINLRVKTDI